MMQLALPPAFIGGLGFSEILLIVGALVLLFGAQKIPKLARSMGQGVNEFKAGLRGEGLAARLVSDIISTNPGRLVLDAQSYLVEWYQRFGFVVAGPEFVAVSRLQRFLESREALVIRFRKVDQADRLSGRCQVHRANVKVIDLLWRKQSEASAPGNDAGDVVGKVEMRRDPGLVSHPETHQQIIAVYGYIVLRTETGQPPVNIRGADIDGLW